MAKANKKKSTIITVVIILVVILLLFGVFMLVRKLSNGFTTDIKTFYVEVDGQTVTDIAKADIMDKPVTVHNIGGKGFKYRIEYTSSTAFYFYVNEEYATSADLTDCTKGFEIEEGDNQLTVKSTDIYQVLSRLYGVSVQIPGVAQLKNKLSFTLVVSNADGSKSVGIEFTVGIPAGTLDGTDITLEPDHLEF